MADTTRDAEAELWNAISAFERILEVLPDDRATLETLAHAYQQVGDHTRARDYLLRLGEVLLNEGDAEQASGVLERLKPYAETDPAARGLADRLTRLVSRGGAPAPTGAEARQTEAVDRQHALSEALRRKTGIADELAIAWDLHQAGELTQEQYAEVVQDLSEMSSSNVPMTVSVLHVLQARGFGNMDRCLAYIARKGEAPVISLSHFDLNPEATGLVPRDYMVRRGVIPFECLGSETLVVCLNPYDRGLRKEVEQVTGRRCHFFMASAVEFDATITRLEQAAKDAAKSAARK